MSRGYKSALASLFLASTLTSFTGCTSAPERMYGGMRDNTPIPLGYTRKDDLLNHVRPEIRQRAKDAYNGVKIDTSSIIPNSNTKITPTQVKVNVPWEKLESMFGQID
jgi:hypothetical protein